MLQLPGLELAPPDSRPEPVEGWENSQGSVGGLVALQLQEEDSYESSKLFGEGSPGLNAVEQQDDDLQLRVGQHANMPCVETIPSAAAGARE